MGDPEVDALIAEHRGCDPARSGRLLGLLFDPEHASPERAALEALSAALPEPPLAEPERIERGQRMFALFGPEVLLILGSYALPLAFAAGDGVQVVYRTRRLKDDPIRRLCDTAQMVVNVMQPGQLARTA